MTLAASPGAVPGARLWAAAAALLATVIWGGWFPVTRLGVLAGDVTPADMVVLRFSVGAFVFLPLVLRKGFKAGRAGWPGTLAIVATLSGPFAIFVGLGVRHAPAVHAAIFIPGTFPAIVFLLGLVIFKDPPSPRRWLGLVAVASGAGLIGVSAFLGGPDAAVASGAWTGYLYFHACAWMWAVYTVIVRYSGLPAAHALGITHVGAALVYGPLWLAYGDTGLFDLTLGQLAFQVGYHGLLNGVVAMFLYNFAIQRLGAAEAAVFAGLVPCFAALSAWPLLGEPIGPAEAVAVVSVGAGVILISGARRRVS